jgi:hypothetical protein
VSGVLGKTAARSEAAALTGGKAVEDGEPIKPSATPASVPVSLVPVNGRTAEIIGDPLSLMDEQDETCRVLSKP